MKVGRRLAEFDKLTEEQWASITVLLNCGVGPNAGKKEDIQVGFAQILSIGDM